MIVFTIMFLSPLGERLGEGVTQGTQPPHPTSPPKGERSLMEDHDAATLAACRESLNPA
jgi:hypothetical protein